MVNWDVYWSSKAHVVHAPQMVRKIAVLKRRVYIPEKGKESTTSAQGEKNP